MSGLFKSLCIKCDLDKWVNIIAKNDIIILMCNHLIVKKSVFSIIIKTPVKGMKNDAGISTFVDRSRTR